MRWVFLGCVIPDVPWIMRRAINLSPVDPDPYWLMSYATVQASLLFCLVLAAAIALMSRRFWPVVAVLSGNAALHLLLDAVEIKPGNGAHFFAPLSWQHFRFDLLWPHSPLIYAATGLGLLFSTYVLFQYRRQPIAFSLPASAKATTITILIAAYLLTPMWLTSGPYEDDNHFVRTLQEMELRPGQRIEIDRGAYEINGSAGLVSTFAGEKLRLTGEMPANATAVSLSGVFVDENTVRVEEIQATTERFRSFASIVGLAFVAGVWLIGNLNGDSILISRGR